MHIDYHKPVLVAEVLKYLTPKPGGLYVDATFGGGGHTRAILECEPDCTVIAVDWDKEALEHNSIILKTKFGKRFKSIWGNFAQLPLLLKKENITKVDGILADFGTSQYQIFEAEGFSFAKDTFLDMRMSPAHQRHTAYDLINKATENELEYIFKEYGQERYARSIARLIAEARRKNPIRTTKQLSDLVISLMPSHLAKSKRIHPATKIFQALRIAVNKELENIQSFLKNGLQLLKKDGRLVCISFHSLEDRIVKNFFRDHRSKFLLLTPKVVMASEIERKANPSSRSARLRAVQKIS